MAAMSLVEDICPVPDIAPMTSQQDMDAAVESARAAVGLPVGARVVAAMSGGVDSTVVAALLHKAGYDVVGVTLQLYDHGAALKKKGACCAGQDIHDARLAAEAIGIPHYVLDYESRFRDAVIDQFADSYLKGQTPVPCIRCNQTVKFRDLLDVARDLGAEAMATGHYVRRAVAGDAVYLADESGLVRLDVADGTAERVFGDSTTSRGTPARPVVDGETVSAAWLPEGAGPGTLWTSTGGDVTLDYGGLTLPAQRRPTFVAAGDSLVLNDARSGWVWSAPDGALLPSSQNWNLDDDVQTASTTNEQEPPPVIDPRPPVAEDDAFGVRPGELVSLPVLLNDHDPNEDVLAVDPASVTGLDPAFGVVTTTDDRQRLAVRVAPDAAGIASFSYAVTDGTSPDGLMSQPATVTLRVVGEGENSAPVWCGVDGCQQDWPSPEVAPGGTISLPVLGDWVDPEGDPVLLLSATDDSGLGQVATTPQGDVVFQHNDTGAADEQSAAVTLTVADARGATTTPDVAQIEAATRRTYSGPLVVGEDLMRFVIGEAVTVQRWDTARQAYSSPG